LNEVLAEAATESRSRTGRTRMCAVTRAVLPESELIRFVAAPDGTVVPDLKAKLPGRGIWISAERGRVAEALRRNAFQRGLSRPVSPPPDLAGQVAARLKEVALGRLGLARKAGAVAAGFSKVEAAIAGEKVAGLLVASNGAEDGVRKMGQVLRRHFAGEASFPVIRIFASEELSLAMGLPNVIHAAVLQAPAGMSFVEAAIRLQRYEGVGDSRVLARAAGPQDKMNE
jgi:predicted RNA-binding protein YlxR (DUF448 family)